MGAGRIHPKNLERLHMHNFLGVVDIFSTTCAKGSGLHTNIQDLTKFTQTFMNTKTAPRFKMHYTQLCSTKSLDVIPLVIVTVCIYSYTGGRR